MADSDFRYNLGNLPNSNASLGGKGSSFFCRCRCDESGGLLGLRAECNGKMGEDVASQVVKESQNRH